MQGVFELRHLPGCLQFIQGPCFQKGVALNQVSRERNIPASTLRRHRDGKVREPGVIRVGQKVLILDARVEASDHEHVKLMEAALFGLTTMDLRRLAYSDAEKLGVWHPFSHENKMAGFDWLRGFLARH